MRYVYSDMRWAIADTCLVCIAFLNLPHTLCSQDEEEEEGEEEEEEDDEEEQVEQVEFVEDESDMEDCTFLSAHTHTHTHTHTLPSLDCSYH